MNNKNQMKVRITAVSLNGKAVTGRTMTASDEALKTLETLAKTPNFGASLGFIRAGEKEFKIKHNGTPALSQRIVNVYGHMVKNLSKNISK